MNYKKYLIKKGKLDLLSSLKALDKELLNETLKKYNLNDIYELKDYILDSFKTFLEISKEDIHTKIYFENLIKFENTNLIYIYDQDIKSFFVFIYGSVDNYNYYLPTEIKEIITNTFGNMTIDAQINLENAANAPLVKDLKELLKVLTIKDLKHIGYLLKLDKLSNKPKKELVNIIYNSLTNKEILTNLIERFTNAELDLLKKLIVNNGTIQDNNISMETYHFLYMTGLVFLFRRNDKFYISMTDDIYNVIKDINLDNIYMIVEENTKVYTLLKAMVELYGVVSLDDLDYNYNLYYVKDPLDMPINSILFCDRMDNINIKFKENDLYFIHEMLNDEDLDEMVDYIIDRQETIERKLIKLKDLLKYSNYDYYEVTPSITKFAKYLQKHNLSSDIVDNIIKTISHIYRIGNSAVGPSIEMLEAFDLEINQNNVDELIEYLMEIYNNSRIWIDYGWTPVEMRENYYNQKAA